LNSTARGNKQRHRRRARSGGGSVLILFRLEEDLLKCGEAKGVEVDAECTVIRDIMLRDLAGLCAFVSRPEQVEGGHEQYAPMNAMGWAQATGLTVTDPDDEENELDLYDVVSISLSGCCGDSDVCPEIPFVPKEKIETDPENIEYVLGFDVDGCLVKVPIGICCEEDDEPDEPPPEEEDPESPPEELNENLDEDLFSGLLQETMLEIETQFEIEEIE